MQLDKIKSYYLSHRTSLEYPSAHKSAGTTYLPVNIEECKVPVFDEEGNESVQDGYMFEEYRINSPEGLPIEAVQALLDLVNNTVD